MCRKTTGYAADNSSDPYAYVVLPYVNPYVDACLCVGYSSWTDWYKTLTVDPSSHVYYQWLMVISVAVVYNLITVIARAVFWKLHDQYLVYWLVTDYIADLVYLIDIAVNMRTGITHSMQSGIPQGPGPAGHNTGRETDFN